MTWSEWAPGVWTAVTNMLGRTFRRHDRGQERSNGSTGERLHKLSELEFQCRYYGTFLSSSGLDESTTEAKYLLVGVLTVSIFSVTGVAVDTPSDIGIRTELLRGTLPRWMIGSGRLKGAWDWRNH